MAGKCNEFYFIFLVDYHFPYASSSCQDVWSKSCTYAGVKRAELRIGEFLEKYSGKAWPST